MCYNLRTCPDRVVNVQHVSLLSPGVRVHVGLGFAVSVVGDKEWAVKLKQPEHGRAARTTLEPNDHGGIQRVHILEDQEEECQSDVFLFPPADQRGVTSWEVYREFQPSYDIVHRWCQGLFRPQVPCTPNLHCLIANTASTQSQQPVNRTAIQI